MDLNTKELFEQRVGGIEPFSMLDFGDYLCGILFYNYCNFRCRYCYNKSIVDGSQELKSGKEIIDFLEKRKNRLDGIVFSGGECTIWGKKLIEDVKFTKNLGYKVKIDTNGSNPKVVKILVENNLVDYIALDYKYPISTNDNKLFHTNTHLKDNFKETLDYLISIDFPFETRTTIHPDITDENKANLILKELEEAKYKGVHHFQFFFDGPETLGNVSQNPRKFDITKVGY